MISILIPTKNRVKNLKSVLASLNETTLDLNGVEVVFYVDRTDAATIEFLKTEATDHAKNIAVKAVIGDHVNLANTYNKAYQKAEGSIIMYSADDVMFRTLNWDFLIRQEFARFPDQICLVFGADGIQPISTLATHGFLTRKAIDAVGYVHPIKMGYNYSDNWLTDIYRRLNRLCYTPVYFEHCHWGVGKAPYDDTYRTGSDAPHQESIDLWRASEQERTQQVQLLQQLIDPNVKATSNSTQEWIEFLQGSRKI